MSPVSFSIQCCALSIAPNVVKTTVPNVLGSVALEHAKAGTVQPAVMRALVCIVRREGVLGLYRGCSAMGLGAGPAHALYFASYELAKRNLSGASPTGHVLPPSPLVTSICSAST